MFSCTFEQPDREVSHQTAFSPKGTCSGLWSDLITDGRLDSPTGQRHIHSGIDIEKFLIMLQLFKREVEELEWEIMHIKQVKQQHTI